MTQLAADLEGDSPAVRGMEQSRTFKSRASNINIRRCILTEYIWQEGKRPILDL